MKSLLKPPGNLIWDAIEPLLSRSLPDIDLDLLKVVGALNWYRSRVISPDGNLSAFCGSVGRCFDTFLRIVGSSTNEP